MSGPTLSPPAAIKPKVAIVGAGIAGLTLALLLEKQGVPYEVYERAKEVKSLGSAMALGAAVVPLFRQLGILEEFMELGREYYGIQIYDDKRVHSYTMDFTAGVDMGGSKGYIIARPVLYSLLLRQIPKERLHFGKKVISFHQSESAVSITTSDDQIYEADILIGADGAYSAVREGLFADLKEENKLPALDDVPLPFTSICLLGQTRVLDKERFPLLKMEKGQFISVLGEGTPFTWSIITTKQNTICWSLIRFLDKECNKGSESFRHSEWGAEATETMCKEVADFAIPGAAPGATPLTLGDVIEESPKDLISKVMLEEKVFDTWHSGRIALMGDACHKTNPAGGQGAINAIHDAVCIANWISVLPSTNVEDIDRIFQEYKQERLPIAKASFETGQMFRDIGGKTITAWLSRFFSKHVPQWLWRIMLAQLVKQRPQLSFLPLVSDLGEVKAEYQPSLEKTLKIAKERSIM